MTGSPVSLLFRDIRPSSDREVIERITRSSGFFEPGEVSLAVDFFNAWVEKGDESGHRFLFADLDGETVGFSNFGPASYSGLSHYLHWIAIDQAFRGKGLGKLILRETENRIRAWGGRKIFIETSSKPEYVSTQGFYRSCGYEVEARLKDFYVPGDDQLIFSKVI